MPIGKDSITKRVAKTQIEEKAIAPELVATVAAAPKKNVPAKKSTGTATSKKPAAKKATPKKETATEKVTSPINEAPSTPLVDSAVLANVSPETVAAVTGHKENTGFEKVQLGGKLPVHLL